MYEVTINGIVVTGSYAAVKAAREQAIRYNIGCSGIRYSG
jgi:hypothetical protein